MNTAQTAPLRTDRSPATAKVDNLLRQALKVSDPNDAQQIADGLLARFADEAGLLERERLGLPAARGAITSPSSASQLQPFSETSEALDELEIDLRQIQTDPATKDIHSELRGIAASIRSAASSGLSAAQLALDPVQRDRAFGARRTLSEHARTARYVGALSGGLNAMYRRLAKSCDIVSNLILVGCGEAMARGSVTRSSFVRSIPVSDLLARRDAAINALRNLIGLEEASIGASGWPRGLVAYRQLLDQMENDGQSDLRSMFNEVELSSRFDELIDLASSNNLDSMRAVGSVAARTVGLINRLISFANGAGISPESPPLASYLSALRLFADAFSTTSRGFRLVYIARPALLSYGVYDGQGNDPQAVTLPQIILLRNQLASQLDCHLGCDCKPETVREQIIYDKLLFEVDRAIDSIGLSSADAAAHAHTAREMAAGALISRIVSNANVPGIPETLFTLSGLFGWNNGLFATPNPVDVLRELCMQEEAEKSLSQLVNSLAAGCGSAALVRHNDPVGDPPYPPSRLVVAQLIDLAIAAVKNLHVDEDGKVIDYDCPSTAVGIPGDVASLLHGYVDGRSFDQA
jgi:hypothetical protein